MYGGHHCASCGWWVPTGATHYCPSTPPAPAPSVNWDRMSDVRIAVALERIAAALERIASAPPETQEANDE